MPMSGRLFAAMLRHRGSLPQHFAGDYHRIALKPDGYAHGFDEMGLDVVGR